MPDRLRATGQGLFFALVFGVGGTSGSVSSGALYDHIGRDTLFGAAALVSVASIIAVRFVK